MRAPSGSRALVPWAQPRSASWSGVRVGWREADARRSRGIPGRPRRLGLGHDDRRIHRGHDADSGEGLLVGHGGVGDRSAVDGAILSMGGGALRGD